MKKKIVNICLAVLLFVAMFLGNNVPGISMVASAEEYASSTDDIRAFVSRMYTVALGREAESGGLDYWSAELENKRIDGAGISYGFIMSDEFRNKNLSDHDYLIVLYRTFFDREPDQGGYENWMNHLANGMSRERVLSEFVNSPEFSGICERFGILRGYMYEDGKAANPGIAQFVYRLYNVALGREGEAGGINDWTTKIAKKEWTAEEVATTGFFDSAEFQEKALTDREFLDILYATFFDRAADEGGLASWTAHLNAGMPRREVILGFSKSEEFINILKSYGVYVERKTIYVLESASMCRKTGDGELGYRDEYEYINCEYDEEGKLTSKTQRSDWGSSIGYFTYDNEGRLIKEIYYTLDGKVCDYVTYFNEDVFDSHRWTEYEYDDRGNVIKKTEYKSDGSILQATENTYDENNNLIKEQYSDTFWYEYYYNKNNDLTYKYVYSDGKRSTRVKNVYDEEGYLTESWGYVSMSGGFPITYYDRNGNPTKTVYRDRDGNIIPTEYDEYDEHGNMVKSVQGDEVDVYGYTYDANGNMTSMLEPDGDYALYTYDANGNCIKEAYYIAGMRYWLIEQQFISFEVVVDED